MKRPVFFRKIFVMAAVCFLLALCVWNWTENQIHFYLSRMNSGLEKIAQVKSKSNDVKRNHKGQLLWQDLDAGETLFIGNSVQTDKNSSTEIVFEDGEQMLIGPESLVRFVKSEDKISLQLIEGKAEIRAPDVQVAEAMRLPQVKKHRLVVATPKGHVELKNSQLKIETKKDQTESFKLEVVAGAPELVTAEKTETLPISAPTERIEVPKIVEPEVPVVTPQETASTESVPAQMEEASRLPAQEEIPAPVPEPLKAPKVKSIKVRLDKEVTE